jgi:hypothetical protein
LPPDSGCGGYGFGIVATTTALILAGATIAAAGITAGVAAATQPKPPKLPQLPRTKARDQNAALFAAQRARQGASGAFGRRDTILTGLGDTASGARKSLLGQ